MRRLGLVCLSMLGAASLASQAAAQQSGSPTADLLDRAIRAGSASQWAATRPAPMAGLSRDSRAWMKAEVRRQVEAPRRPIEVALAIDAAMAKDMARLAKDKRIHPQDVSNAVLLKIMNNARIVAALDLAAARKAGSPEADKAAERLAVAETNRREALELQSQVSLALATK